MRGALSVLERLREVVRTAEGNEQLHRLYYEKYGSFFVPHTVIREH